MEWYWSFSLMLGSMMLLIAFRMPVAFCFLLINIIVALGFGGGEAGLIQLVRSIRSALVNFSLVPLVMFVLMGEVMLQSGIASDMINAVDKWIMRLPGRLSLIAVGAGVMFATLTGASMASCAMLGSVLVPDMEKRGYKKQMTLGPIMGSAGLAVLIPPTALGVLLGALAEISIAKLMIAIIMPALLLAGIMAFYIIGRCWLQPSLAPVYEVPSIPLSDKLMSTVRHVLPIGVVIFLVIGVIFLGVCSPTEASALGALGCFGLVAGHKRLNWDRTKRSFRGTFRITVMLLMIIATAAAFAQNLAYMGATKGMIEFVLGLHVAPILIFIGMQVVVGFLCCFMAQVPVMMITLPLFMPVVRSLGFNELWFAVIYLVNLETGNITPPFGLNLFVMKQVAPPDTTMGDVIQAAVPFIYCNVLLMVLIGFFPAIALWLPNLIH